ncbi:hypothetical protein GN244_ATG16024 [Phytophthora infestans]|uniref:Transmembrane protein n=1 Tax=Phytophthora infestans TaxID=4787 RepID=A0A833S415_PHYIN|nr:hypothetical protein GN244_ATG16024 [Phytophthora infestans]KAF4143673.1 hypothetical protein GN958_ATG07128 [Phytophthora infestans]
MGADVEGVVDASAAHAAASMPDAGVAYGGASGVNDDEVGANAEAPADRSPVACSSVLGSLATLDLLSIFAALVGFAFAFLKCFAVLVGIRTPRLTLW